MYSKNKSQLISNGLWALVLASLISSCSFLSDVQKPDYPEDGLTIGFYNVENLFDTINDPDIRDEAYLPESEVPWNTERYLQKLDNLGQVIASMDTLGFPYLLGLCEVENRAVLEDLAANHHIREAEYEIIHYEGPDRRGIEVAMLYRPGYFLPVHTESLNVHWEGMGRSNPRDILYVKGVVYPKDTLHVFVNHWPSRWGGEEASRHLRIGNANFLRSKVDSLFAIDLYTNIVIMGDFNDNPDDASLFGHLRAFSPDEEIRHGHLFNLAMEPYLLGEGTLFFNNNWDYFDQIIVSSNLIKPVHGHWVAGPIEVIRRPWMLFYPPRGGEPRPNRTASSRSYFGGYSDHLPVMFRLTREASE